jgi:hypothetical protein
LAAAGLLYPTRWKAGDGLAHHPLMSAIVGEAPHTPLGEELLDWMETEPKDVLISSEAALYGFGRDRRDLLLGFLRSAGAMRAVAAAVAIRRIDRYCESVYAQEARAVDSMPGLAEYSDRVLHSLVQWFETLALMADLLGAGRCRIVKFRKDQAYFEELLDALGATPQRLAKGRVPPVSNETFTWKGQIALSHTRRLSEELGYNVRRNRLWRVIRFRLARLPGDRTSYSLLGSGRAGSIAEAALEIARASGFAPYLAFFGNDGPDPLEEAAPLDYDVLTGEDKRLLDAAMRACVAACGPKTLPGE